MINLIRGGPGGDHIYPKIAWVSPLGTMAHESVLKVTSAKCLFSAGLLYYSTSVLTHFDKYLSQINNSSPTGDPLAIGRIFFFFWF